MFDEKGILVLDVHRLNYVISNKIIRDDKGYVKNMGIYYGVIKSSSYKNKYRILYHDDLYYVHNEDGTLGGFQTMKEAKDYVIRLNNDTKKSNLKPSYKNIEERKMDYLYIGHNKLLVMNENGNISTIKLE